MSTNFWELLQQHQGDLTKSGRTVAEYLVQHAAEAQYLSISSLARECQVAEATVFRFCRALGFEGYHEMRIALAQANATGVLVNQQEPAPDADTATLCEHASALFMTAINGAQNALSPQAVDQAVALLHSARQVFCMGQGGSMAAANEICARFACITNKFRATADSHMQVMAASLMTEQDVVLFVSYSGATRDLMETLRTAKANGAKIILITHYDDAPGAALADVVLLCGAQDARVRFTCANDAGCGGDALEQTKHPGAEDYAAMARSFPYWFCGNRSRYIDHPEERPYDQHFLLGAIAPRFAAVSSASLDRWADPYSQQLCCAAASPAWELHGLRGFVGTESPAAVGAAYPEGHVAYHLRGGLHYLSRQDWLFYMDFVRRHKGETV